MSQGTPINAVALFLFFNTGCQNVKNVLGVDHSAPDELQVAPLAPLAPLSRPRDFFKTPSSEHKRLERLGNIEKGKIETSNEAKKTSTSSESLLQPDNFWATADTIAPESLTAEHILTRTESGEAKGEASDNIIFVRNLEINQEEESLSKRSETLVWKEGEGTVPSGDQKQRGRGRRAFEQQTSQKHVSGWFRPNANKDEERPVPLQEKMEEKGMGKGIKRKKEKNAGSEEVSAFFPDHTTPAPFPLLQDSPSEGQNSRIWERRKKPLEWEAVPPSRLAKLMAIPEIEKEKEPEAKDRENQEETQFKRAKLFPFQNLYVSKKPVSKTRVEKPRVCLVSHEIAKNNEKAYPPSLKELREGYTEHRRRAVLSVQPKLSTGSTQSQSFNGGGYLPFFPKKKKEPQKRDSCYVFYEQDGKIKEKDKSKKSTKGLKARKSSCYSAAPLRPTDPPLFDAAQFVDSLLLTLASSQTSVSKKTGYPRKKRVRKRKNRRLRTHRQTIGQKKQHSIFLVR